MRTFIFAAFSFSCLASLPTALQADELRVRVAAGEHARRDTIVSIDLPPGAAGPWEARAPDGSSLPVQVTADLRARFVVPELEAGETAEFALEPVLEPYPHFPWVEVLREEGRLRLSVAGDPVFYYQARERPLTREELNPRIKRGGFLHPVISPRGTVVTQSYPQSHPHHQGIWSPWAKTRFEGRTPDFWNMHAGTGKVEPKEVEATWSGPVFGGFRASHQFVDLSGGGKVALEETWTVDLYQVGDQGRQYRIFDLHKYQECATESPLELPQHLYGGLGFRGRDEWMGEENTFFLTSEGETDRVAGNGSRTRWTYVGGEIDGERTGIVIMCHPDNFRFPQPVRLHPHEPFFCYAPSQEGDWAITPEEPYRARYRFVVLDDEPDVELIERLWHDYATPPETVVLP